MNTDPEELLIGAHCSAAGGVYNALLEGKKIGATTIQLFTANQRTWNTKPLEKKTIDLWNETLKETGLQKIMSHDSYLINLGSPVPESLEKSRNAFREEIKRCLDLKIDYLNFHPGAALKSSEEECLDRIVESLLEFESLLSNGTTRLVLETTAGQGSNVGWKFEHLGYIVDRVKAKVPIGVCIDTCHIFAAGYDIRTPESWNRTLDTFDQIVGLKHLYGFHVNDSLKGLGSRVDRHKPLGEGLIGIDSFRFLMQSERTRLIPKYLETPGGPPLWVDEIQRLRDFAK
ncbi:MAG: deoxyribonuclease IV [Waddliaceae bacterium]